MNQIPNLKFASCHSWLFIFLCGFVLLYFPKFKEFLKGEWANVKRGGMCFVLMLLGAVVRRGAKVRGWAPASAAALPFVNKSLLAWGVPGAWEAAVAGQATVGFDNRDRGKPLCVFEVFLWEMRFIKIQRSETELPRK